MLACLNQSPTIRVGGCAGGRDNSVAGVVACLLARGQFAGVALSVSSRRAWRRAGRIRHRFRLGDLPRACPAASSRWRCSYPWRLASMSCPRAFYSFSIITRLVGRLVSHLGGRLVVPALSSCPRCVFLVFFSSRSSAACAYSICPRARLASASRLPVSSGGTGSGAFR